MKKVLVSFVFILILSILSISAAVAQVQTRVRVIEASNVGSNIDSSLRDVTGQISSLFSFSSYRLLKEETVTLQKDQPVSIPVHPGRSLELTLIKQRREGAEVRVKIKREGSEILNTQVRLTPGRTVSIGGPKHREGTILIALALL
jgi:ArsR family metal-binding transcriptional regulator